jgi:hypothetical protein
LDGIKLWPLPVEYPWFEHLPVPAWEHVAQPFPDLTPQDRFAVFRNPHHVIFQVIDSMRGLSVSHAAILTQVQRGVENGLPKGRGFYPIYRQ